jgi:O-antigen ligase
MERIEVIMSRLTKFIGTASKGRNLRLGVIVLTILAAILLGLKASVFWILLPIVGIGGALLIQYPYLGLLAIPVTALVVRTSFSTGTAVVLNMTTFLLMALIGLWVVRSLILRQPLFASSRTNTPLMLFLAFAALSLLIGNVIWKPSVPRSGSFLLVQVAQWAIFALSAGAYWLTGRFAFTVTDLRHLILVYLALAGSLAILFVIPGMGSFLYYHVATGALNRAPFWMLLAAVSYGELCYDEELSKGWRLFLVLVLMAVVSYIFYWNRDSASTWVTVVAVIGVITWMRWPAIRRLVLPLVLILTLTGVLTSTLYEFAGGDAEWEESGGSRLSLIRRVLEVSLHNPITGLGPASYRLYAGVEPLKYGQAVWFQPQINSHNNYVDVFAHTGIIGLGLFLWFIGEIGYLAWTLSQRYQKGFLGGYVSIMIGVWVGSNVLMMLADWMLPFVYNIGFTGFQASAPVWLFLGGLVTVENLAEAETRTASNGSLDHHR